MARRSKPRVIGSLVLGFLECVIFGVTINGWPNLVFVLKQEGLFSHLCQNQTRYDHQNGSDSDSVPICGEADLMFNLCFSVSLALFLASGLPIGILFDRYGLWITRVSATLFYVPGILMLAFSQEGPTAILIFPGLTMWAVAGMHIVVTTAHLTLQAGNMKSMVAAVYSGGLGLGVVVLLVVKLAYENHGITHQASLSFVCGLWLVVIVNTFVCCPRYKLPSEDSAEEKKATDSIDAGGITESHGPVSQAHVAVGPEKEATFTACLRTPYYWLMIAWFSMVQLKFVFFLGSMNTWLSVKTNNDIERVSAYTNALSFIWLAGFIVSPWGGLLSDRMVKRGLASDSKLPFLAMAKAVSPCLWIGSLLAIAHSVAALFFSDVMVYLNFVIFIVFRPFLYGIEVIYIGRVFPMAQYGKCVGLLYLVSAVISCIQYALFAWAEASLNFELINGVLLVLMVLTLCLPIYIEMMYRFNSLSTKKKLQHIYTTKL